MQDRLADIRATGGELATVTQARPTVLDAWLRNHPRPFPVVSDPDREAYRAFDLERGRWAMFFRPGTMLHYIGLMVRGWVARPPLNGEDVLQLGGDFVLDRRHRLVFAHRSADPADRPAPELLVEQVRALAGAGQPT